MAIFQKTFNAATFENAKKYHTSFSQLMEKYHLTEDELEKAIRNVFHKKKADEMLRAFREQDEKRAKKKHVKNPSHVSQPSDTLDIPAVPEAIIVAELNDTVDEVLSTIDDANSEEPKSELEFLLEKEVYLKDRLSESERELEKLHGIRAEIDQKVKTLIEEVHDLKATIDKKVAEVGELRDYRAEVNKQTALTTADSEALKNELAETEAAIKVAQVVTITVLNNSWFKFEPESVDIPHVEVLDEELIAASAKFALDTRFERMTFGNIRQLITLDKMILELRKEHTNIEVQFEDDAFGVAWNTWKQE